MKHSLKENLIMAAQIILGTVLISTTAASISWAYDALHPAAVEVLQQEGVAQ